MKISKIEISNFRGIEGTYTLDLTDKLSVLDGENGFGKTTIFDAIEFCLTGDVKRLSNLPQGNKPKGILKNNDNQESIVKIIFNSDKQVIRKIASFQKGDLTEKYTLTDTSGILNYINLQAFKDTFYVPQDDSTELLKSTKGSYTSFINNLLGIQNEIDFKNEYLQNPNNSEGRLIKRITKIEDDLKEKEKNISGIIREKDIQLEKFSEIKNIQEIVFMNISSLQEVVGNNTVDWSNGNKYTKDTINNQYLSNWRDLGMVTQNKENLYQFSLNTRTREKIESININKERIEEYYNYYLFYKSDFKEDLKIRAKVEGKINKFKGYLINFKLLEKNNNQLNNLDVLFANLDKGDFLYTELLNIEVKFNEIKKQLSNLNKEQKEYELLFGNLIDFWENKFENHENHELIINSDYENNTLNSGKCPLCRAPNKTNDIKEQLSFLKEKSGINIEEGKKNLFSELYNQELLNKFDEYIKKIEKELKEIKEAENNKVVVQNNEQFFKDFSISLEKYNIETEKVVLTSLDFSKKISEEQKLLNRDVVQKIINFGNSKIKAMDDFTASDFEELNIKYNKLFRIDYSFTESTIKDLSIIEINNNISYFENELLKLKNTEKISLSKEVILLKKEVLFYAKRREFLEFTKKTILGKYSTSIESEVNEYKIDKIKNIALPFYLFNQRIVKNYNGMKFYLDEKSINGAGGTNNPMFTLSSGQAEGMALSLMLANNLNDSSRFDTILIDDPIQSLDDLNILSFINLLRYQFPDKQIIISTHEQDFSNFIRYKYWRLYGNVSQKSINMKERFFIK